MTVWRFKPSELDCTVAVLNCVICLVPILPIYWFYTNVGMMYLCWGIYSRQHNSWWYNSLLQRNGTLSKRYKVFLERYSLSVSVGKIQWYTSRVNGWLVRSSNILPRQWQQAWFTAGAVIGVLLVPLSVGLLTFTLFSFIGNPTADAKNHVLVPVVRLSDIVRDMWLLSIAAYSYLEWIFHGANCSTFL